MAQISFGISVFPLLLEGITSKLRRVVVRSVFFFIFPQI